MFIKKIGFVFGIISTLAITNQADALSIAAGDTTQDSSVIWTKTEQADNVLIEYSTDSDFKTIVDSISVDISEPLIPVKQKINSLNPKTTYYYRATDSSNNVVIGKFRTPATVGNQVGLSFGVSGDWRGELAPYPAISNASTANLDFFIELGDTIYADFPSPAVNKSQAETLEEYRLKHQEVYGADRFGLNINTWQNLRSSTSIFATIDDHEVMNNFSGGANADSDDRFSENSGLINETQLFKNGLQAFAEYNPIEDLFYGVTGEPRTEGKRNLYRYRNFGSDASIFILDARSFRDKELPPADINDPNSIAQFLARSFDTSRTMLGQIQLDQLKLDLLDAQQNGVTWKFVIVPEPIQNLGLVGAGDRFEGYAAERTEILKFIKENGINNVVFVAADVHGTLVNNLTYQENPTSPQIETNAFEVTTGSVAFDAPLGTTVVAIAFQLGLLTEEQVIAYNSLPTNEAKDTFIETFTNNALDNLNLGYDHLGLQGSPINATLIIGNYLATHTFGWTKFDIDADTQKLTITTYGIDPYTQAQLESDPDGIINRTPQIVSQFQVNPTQTNPSSVPY